MLRTVAKLGFLSLLVVAGAAGLMLHRRDTTAAQLNDAKQKNEQLRQIVQRLEAERRVADVIVTDQKTEGGVQKTTLLFVNLTTGCSISQTVVVRPSKTTRQCEPRVGRRGDA